MSKFEVGEIRFEFGASWEVVEFDETNVFKNGVMRISRSKGVDFLGSYKSSQLLLLEVTDYRGHPDDDRKKGEDGHSDEVGQKLISTLAAVVGASRMHPNELWKKFAKLAIGNENRVNVVYHYDTDIFPADDRRLRARYKTISDKLDQKLKWLACRVMVTSTKTFAGELPELGISNLAGAGRP